MFRLVSALLCTFATALAANDPTAEPVRGAQALLGPGVWSRVVAIENSARCSEYPHFLHALVFETAGRLWFYTPVNGTQSLSLRRNRLATDEADFGPLLRAIEPGFERYALEPTGAASVPSEPTDAAAALPNGCFIASLVALQQRRARGEWLPNARLLSFYETVPGRREPRGHTVLAYDTIDGIGIFDPADPRAMITVTRSAPDGPEPLGVARQYAGAGVVRAVTLPLDPPAAAARAVASTTGHMPR